MGDLPNGFTAFGGIAPGSESAADAIRRARAEEAAAAAKAKEIIEVYTSHFPHGISCASVMGGYSHQQMYLLHTVLSSYEEQEAIRLIRKTDPGVIINVMKTSEFYGKYVTPTIE